MRRIRAGHAKFTNAFGTGHNRHELEATEETEILATLIRYYKYNIVLLE
jgi:hypothetical protein